MAYWHNPDGTPARPFKGEFDWTHVPPLLLLVGPLVFALVRYCSGP